MIISKISYEKSPEEAREWINAIINHAYVKATELGYNVKLFLANVYSMIIFYFTNRFKNNQNKWWYNWVMFLLEKGVIENSLQQEDLLAVFCYYVFLLIRNFSDNLEKDLKLLREKILSIWNEETLKNVVCEVYYGLDGESRDMWKRLFLCYVKNCF